MADVSRETPAVPDVPSVAERVFPSARLGLAVRYAGLLAGEGVTRGLIGPREVPRLWDRHLLNCAVLAEIVPLGVSVADVGSGAGLPGVVLAIARPDVRVTLVEPLLRRTSFLEEAVEALGLGEQVEVLRARAEDVPVDRRFDVVTARAVAPLERLARWCLPLVAPGGVVLAMKGASAAQEIADAAPALRRLGVGHPELVELGRGVLAEPTWGVRLVRPQGGPVGWRERSATRAAKKSTRSRRTS
jgi:16S rRNA (guanine527-N7)-methyltransferase